MAILAGLAEEPTAEEVVVRSEVVDTGIGLDRPPPSASSSRSPNPTHPPAHGDGHLG